MQYYSIDFFIFGLKLLLLDSTRHSEGLHRLRVLFHQGFVPAYRVKGCQILTKTGGDMRIAPQVRPWTVL